MKVTKHIIYIIILLTLSLPLQPIKSFCTDNESTLVLDYNNNINIKNIL